MTITAKQQAKLDGAKTYQGGECKHHVNWFTRWTSNGCCTKYTLKSASKHKIDHADKLVEKRREWDRNNPKKAMLQRARRRARNLGLKFDIDISDVQIPELCPVLGIKLERFSPENLNASPSLDRIHNHLGYEKGNVVVVSFLANRIKNNASYEELKKVVDYYAQYQGA